MWGWVLYDFANTVFSVSILSYYFPLWLADELGGGASLFNYVTAASMLLVALTAPFLGAVADLRQRRKPYLIAFTLVAVACTAAFDLVGSVAPAAALFVAANVAFQSALLFYNALLPSVAGTRGAGRVSGYGTAAGYAGSLLAVLALSAFVSQPEAVRSALGPLGGFIQTSGAVSSNAFLPTAVLYLLFALPSFVFVGERAVRAPRPVRVRATYRGVLRTVGEMRANRGLGAFMLATFLYTDAANTVIANLALYGRQVFDLGSDETRNLLLFSTVFAALGATAFDFACDRLGPRRAMRAVLVTWIVAIALAASAPTVAVLYLAGPLIGVALGSTWVVSRVMLIALAPPEKIGELFGFYSLAGKISAVAGPLITALLLTGLDGFGTLAYRIAIASLALMTGAALVLMRFVPDARPEPVVAELAR